MGRNRVIFMCSPERIVEINKRFLVDHPRCEERLKLLNSAGFLGLSKLNLAKMDVHVLDGIVDGYSDIRYRVSDADVSRVYGCSVGGSRFNKILTTSQKSLMVKVAGDLNLVRQKQNSFCFDLKQVEERLNDDGVSDSNWVKLYIFYAIGCLFAPSATRALSMKFLYYLDSIEHIQDWDWIEFILRELNDAIKYYLEKKGGNVLKIRVLGDLHLLVVNYNHKCQSSRMLADGLAGSTSQSGGISAQLAIVPAQIPSVSSPQAMTYDSLDFLPEWQDDIESDLEDAPLEEVKKRVRALNRVIGEANLLRKHYREIIKRKNRVARGKTPLIIEGRKEKYLAVPCRRMSKELRR